MRPIRPWFRGAGATASRRCRYLVVSHVMTTGGAHALTRHLARVGNDVALIEFPLDDFSDMQPRLTVVDRDGAVLRVREQKLRLAPPLSYVRDVLVLFWWGTRLPRTSMIIALDNLNTIGALILRSLGRTDTVVFYTIDVVPNRFANRVLNRIYKVAERIAAQKADVVWLLTEEMHVERQRIWPTVSFAPTIVVPQGCEYHGPGPQRDTLTIGFIGHIVPHVGLQAAVSAMKLITGPLPEARLLVVGDGPYLETLRQLALREGVEDAIQWYGYVPDHAGALDLLATCSIGIAPYRRQIDRWTRFADPGKIRAYLSCGLAVVATDVPPVAREIITRNCGVICGQTSQDLAEAILGLVENPSRLAAYRKNALKLGLEYDWSAIFGRALSETDRVVAEASPRGYHRGPHGG